MSKSPPPHFRLKAIPLFVGAVLFPAAHSLALDFAQSPAGGETFVAPNVIFSMDNSKSVFGVLDYGSGDGSGGNSATKTRGYSYGKITDLRKALQEVMGDKMLLPDGKIRLAWQRMNASIGVNKSRGGDLYKKGNLLIDFFDKNISPYYDDNFHYPTLMRSFEGKHREKFLSTFVASDANSARHLSLVRSADNYMRRHIDKNSPWADIPGEKLVNDPTGKRTKPLGCRRNYHILFTYGPWHLHEKEDLELGNFASTSRTLPDGTLYNEQQARLFFSVNNSYQDMNRWADSLYGFDKDGGSDGGSYWRGYTNYKHLKDEMSDRSILPIYRHKGWDDKIPPYATTLSDWVMKSWADPLQAPSSLDGNISLRSAYENAPLEEKITYPSIGKASIGKYWNPKYNPATWPHMETMIVSLGGLQMDMNDTVGILGKLYQYPMFKSKIEILNGNSRWSPWNASGNTNDDFLRASMIGRGGGLYAGGQHITDSLKAIIQKITASEQTPPSPALSSAAQSGYNATRSDVGIFTASYDPLKQWSGTVMAETFQTENGSSRWAWGGQTTADKLDAASPDKRVIVTARRTNTTGGAQGIPFRWDKLSDKEKTLFGQAGAKILNYLRGDRTLECPDTGCTTDKPLRKRHSRQGDIINSDLWYTGGPEHIGKIAHKGYFDFSSKQAKRPAMLYVGGNDGMLHGFSAEDGTERLAYIPNGLLSEVSALAQPAYNGQHRYFVDGSPMTGDVQDGKQWKTMLVGSLGAGGKGYFVLDVTNPASFAEKQADQIVVADLTLPPKTNAGANEVGSGWLGHIFAKPVRADDIAHETVQITQLNNGRWAAVMGNGYGSSRGQAALLIQYLDGDKSLHVIPTPAVAGGENGLSAPRLVDINGDGRPDVVYAGDLHGNLWKFLINTNIPEQWAVQKWQGQAVPLFTAARGHGHSANTGNSTRQAITSAPMVRVNDRQKTVIQSNGSQTTEAVKGMMVSFGTGRNVTTQDPQEKQQQTLYSILDNTIYRLERDSNKKATGRVLVCDTQGGACDNLVKTAADLPRAVTQAELVQRSIPKNASQKRNKKDYWTVDASAPLDYARNKGWFMDFPMGGERLLKNMRFFDGSNLMEVVSQVPTAGSAVESCDPVDLPPNGKQFVTYINIQDGKAPRASVIGSAATSVGNTASSATQVAALARFEMPPTPLTYVDYGESLQSLMAKKAMASPKAGAGAEMETEPLNRMPEEAFRTQWRQQQATK